MAARHGIPLVALLAVGCAATLELAEVDLSGAQWAVRTGQAVWKRGPEQPPLAGDVILARHENGDVLVNFSKPPLSIFTARTSGETWSLDFVDRGRSRTGRGEPPKRFVWFFLPRILAGAPPPATWRVDSRGDARWSFVHDKTGETITLVLDP